MKPIFQWLSFFSVAFICLFCTACDEMIGGGIEDTISRTFQVQPGGKLNVVSSMGSLEITTSADPVIRIDIQRITRASDPEEAEEIRKDMNIDFRQEGNEVTIETRYRDSKSLFGENRIQLRYLIRVPQRFHLNLKTGGGSIQVSDLEGNLVAGTSGGSLHFGQIRGTVQGHTSGGSISLDGGAGTVDVGTSGGSIRLGKVSASVKAHTSGGSITLEEVMGSVTAATSGGSVSARLTTQPPADCKLSTSGGSIRVKLAAGLNLNLRADCSGGSIHTDLREALQGEIGKHRLNARLNQGGPELYLHSSGGGITIDSTQ